MYLTMNYENNINQVHFLPASTAQQMITNGTRLYHTQTSEQVA